MTCPNYRISPPDVSRDSSTSETARLRLTETQQAVLSEVDLDARATVEAIASATELRPSTVRHTLERLKSMLDLRPCCWTDPYRMGETPYRVFFSIHAGGNDRLRAFLEFLTGIPEIHWVGTLIGHYQVGLHLRASSVGQLRGILDTIDESFGHMIVQKEYGIISELTFLPHSPLRDKKVKQPKISFRATSDTVTLDEIDRVILRLLQERPLAPLSELGRSLGMPTTTVAYRFNNMVRKQVILGFFYSHDERAYGFESYLLLVSVVGLGSKVGERFRQFARKHPQILMFTSCTGRWDFEFEVVVSDVRDLQVIVDDLHAAADGAVRDVLIHAWGHDLKG